MSGEAKALHLGRSSVLAFLGPPRERVRAGETGLIEGWESISLMPFMANPVEW
jgi:hypothetical protein